jgi:hypothetical protein
VGVAAGDVAGGADVAADVAVAACHVPPKLVMP